MGADLLGYTIVRPLRGSTKIAEKHIAKIKTVLSSTKLTDAQKMKSLGKLSVELNYSHDVESMSDAEYIETIKDLVESVKLGDEGGRDLSTRWALIGGRKIEILFAGDMSWGDEPDGHGYNILKTYDQLGISHAWERAIK